ncbi:MAG: nuclear transport factor 2 family protein [Halioglobus sp.]
MSDNRLDELLAKQAITEVIFRYARAVDRLDEMMLRSVFHPGSMHWHFYQGPSSDPSLPTSNENPGDFVAYAMHALGKYTRTHHQMGNTLIRLESDNLAHSETYFTAFHRMRAIGDPLAAPDAYDTEMDFFVGGRYIDVFEYRDDTWAITNRTGMTDWTRLEAPFTKGFNDIAEETRGQRAPQDLIYKSGSI